jgi:hypothetical protein
VTYNPRVTAKVKGGGMLNARDFARLFHGEGAWDRVLAALTPAQRETIAGVISVGWYEIRLSDAVNRAMVDVLGGGDMDVIRALGRYSAEQDLTRVHRLFLRLANPAYVIERLTEFWARFQDSGKWTVVRETPTRARATLEGWGAEEVASCERLGAYTQRLFELVGAKDVRLEHPRCRMRGDEACVFLGEWR